MVTGFCKATQSGRSGLGALVVVLLWLAGCTPQHVAQTAGEVAADTRLTSSTEIRRSSEVTLSRQSQLCLVSDRTGSKAGLKLLQNMQEAMSGYFYAVGVESRPLDYGAAIRQSTCPGANYILYVQVIDAPCKLGSDDCDAGTITDLLITILNTDGSGVTDRITLTLKRSWLRMAVGADADQRAAFEKLARTLTGVAAQ